MKTGLAFTSLLVALCLPACNRNPDQPPAAPVPANANANAAGATLSSAQQERVGRGEAIAELACASCHAIGAAGDSPHAEATPFRLLSRSAGISTLEKALAGGKVTDHPDMPDWAFDPLDLDGLIAYLETIQVSAGQ